MSDIRQRLTEKIRTLRERARQLSGEADALKAKADALVTVRDALTDADLTKLAALKDAEVIRD